MAKVEHKVNVSITGVGPLSDLLEVMAANYDDLPDAVKEAAQQIDEDPTTYNADYLLDLKILTNELRVYVDGCLTGDVISGSRIGKMVRVSGKAPFRADSFWVVSPYGFVCGWGVKPEIGGDA